MLHQTDVDPHPTSSIGGNPIVPEPAVWNWNWKNLTKKLTRSKMKGKSKIDSQFKLYIQSVYHLLTYIIIYFEMIMMILT